MLGIHVTILAPPHGRRRWLLAAGAVVAGVGTVSGSAYAEEHPWDRYEQADLAKVERERPHALQLYREAEGLALRGESTRAAEVFEVASDEAPESAVLAHRHCLERIGLEQRGKAIAACQRAMAALRTPPVLRHTVAAITLGHEPLSPWELVQAMTLAKAGQQGGTEARALGYGSQCDIARRTGDLKMLRVYERLLSGVAADHAETLRARAALEAARPGPLWRAGWWTCAIMFVFTVVHAVRNGLARWARPAHRRDVIRAARSTLIPFLAIMGTMTRSTPARAANQGEAPAVVRRGFSTRFPVHDADPMASVPTPTQRDKDPLEFGYHLMDLTDRAEEAAKQKNFRAAGRYFQALGLAVPDESVAFGKACQAFESAGDREQALEMCQAAIAKHGVRVDDFVRLVRLQLAKPTALLPSEVQDIDSELAHLRSERASATLVERLACELALRLKDDVRLRLCTEALAAVAPEDPQTISFSWALAVEKGDYGKARALIERMRKTDIKPDGLRRMEETTEKAIPRWRRWIRDWRVVLVASLFVVMVPVAVMVATRRRLGARPA